MKKLLFSVIFSISLFFILNKTRTVNYIFDNDRNRCQDFTILSVSSINRNDFYLIPGIQGIKKTPSSNYLKFNVLLYRDAINFLCIMRSDNENEKIYISYYPQFIENKLDTSLFEVINYKDIFYDNEVLNRYECIEMLRFLEKEN
jgi:hypothetical protein